MQNNLFSRRAFVATTLSFAAISMTSLPAIAKTISRFSLSKKGFALKGYDTTAYLETNKPADGSDATVVEWKGAKWRFVSEEDAALFRSDPEAYAPQFGGYCTRAMSIKKEVPGDPEVWRIHNGKLYVFYARRGGVAFDKGEDAMIKLAQVHWDTLTHSE